VAQLPALLHRPAVSHPTINSNYKTDALAERLLATSTYRPNASNVLIPADSSSYIYTSSTRGISYYYGIVPEWAADTVINMRYDTAIGFKPSDAVIFTYDARPNITSNTDLNWNTPSSSFVNYWKYAYSFNAHNDLTYFLDQNWYSAGSSWQNLQQSTVTYDANFHQLVVLAETWVSASSSWRSSDKYTRSYNGSGQLTDEVHQTGTLFTNYEQKVYSYDANNNLTLLGLKVWNNTLQNWVYGYNLGVNSTKTLYTYTANNKVASIMNQKWLTTDSTFHNISNVLYTYDANNNVTATVNQNWSGTAWRNASQELDSYDASNNKLVATTQNWDTTQAQWVNSTRTTSVYDSYNNVTLKTSESWISGAWAISSVEHYYYGTYTTTGIDPLTAAGTELKLYPSPASSIVSVDLRMEQPQPATLGIYDIQGMLHRQWSVAATGSYAATIPVADLSAGIYYLRVSTTAGQSTRAFTVER
jgi:hypothetical protein